MNDKISFLDKKSRQLINILKAGERTPPPDQSRSSRATTQAILLIAALIGTTLPYNATNILFGTLTLVFTASLALTLWLERKALPLKRFKLIIAGVTWAFVATGCSGYSLQWLDEPPIPMVVLQNPEKEYKKGAAEGYAILGFGLDDITEKTAMQNGNITKAFATQQSRSYGWISVAKIWVYGE